ncbi:MAG: hypothetical protein U1D30_15000 [Planctomycetota bacterium]
MRLRSCLAICVAVATLAVGVQSASAGFVVNWNIDSAQSSLTLNIPQQGVPLDLGSGVSTIQIRLRNQSGGTSWTDRKTAPIAGTIATDMDLINSTIEFLGGASNMWGVAGGNYKPNAADPPDNNLSAPAVFAATAAQVLIFVDAANIAIRDVFYDADSAPLGIVPVFPGTGARTFNAAGINRGTKWFGLLCRFRFGRVAGCGYRTVSASSCRNTSTNGTITVPNVLLPQREEVDDSDQYSDCDRLGGSYPHGICDWKHRGVCHRPRNASSFMMAGMAISAFAVPSFVRYRRGSGREV